MFSNSYTINKPNNFSYLSKVQYNTDNKCYYNNNNNNNYKKMNNNIKNFNMKQNELKKYINK